MLVKVEIEKVFFDFNENVVAYFWVAKEYILLLHET